MRTVRLNIRISADERDRYRAAARATGASLSKWVRRELKWSAEDALQPKKGKVK